MLIFHLSILLEGETKRQSTAIDEISTLRVNPLTADAAYIRVFIFY